MYWHSRLRGWSVRAKHSMFLTFLRFGIEQFDVHDDVRSMSDIRVEKDESHAGKVVERRWFERNKHIFPARCDKN